jgi:hypothetical protein
MFVILALSVVAPLAAQEEKKGEDTQYREIKNKLNSMRISVDFRDTPLRDAIDFIRDFSQLNFHIDTQVFDDYSEDDLVVTMKVKGLLLKSVLKLMLNTRGLTAMYKEGVVVITTPDKIHAASFTKIYDVRDLQVRINDFVGPIVELRYEGSGHTPLAGATFTLDEAPEPTYDQDFLVEILQQTTGGDSWEENENASIEWMSGLLIITQSRKAHNEIMRMLMLLRQFM